MVTKTTGWKAPRAVSEVKDVSHFIEKSLGEASQIALSHFGRVSWEAKGSDNNQIRTVADTNIGSLLIRRVEERYPKHNIIDEEQGVKDRKSEYTWVFDPIDGTSNFANKSPNYGIMMGLLKGSEAVAGGIALPAFSEIYTAEKGKGTVLKSSEYPDGIYVTATQETKLSNVLFAIGVDGHPENTKRTEKEFGLLAQIALNVRNLRDTNSVTDVAYVLRGTYGGSVNTTSKIWDNVAQQPLVEGANAVYTDVFGNKMDYSDPISKVDKNYTWCIAPAELHKQLQAIVRKFDQENDLKSAVS